jgi:hypothetical protein
MYFRFDLGYGERANNIGDVTSPVEAMNEKRNGRKFDAETTTNGIENDEQWKMKGG